MKKIFLLLFIFINSLNIYSQDTSDKFKNKGYFNITKVTYYNINNAKLDFVNTDNSIHRMDVKSKDSNGFGLQTINGYFISPKFSVGIGVGMERFNNPNSNTLPVFLDLRYYFKDDFNSIYIYGNAGTNLKLDNSFNKGAMANVGIGYKCFIDDKIAIVPSIGYDHRFIDLPNSANSKISDLTLSSLSISLGLIF